MSSLTDAEYRSQTEDVLARVEAIVDAWLQDDVVDIDSHRTGGLLELALPGAGGKIVINTQPPLHELWLAARRGGFHFRNVDGRWIERDGGEFYAVLSACASEEQCGRPLQFASA